MAKGSKKRKETAPPKQPFYGLTEIKCLIEEGSVFVQGNALKYAREDFEWGISDILAALASLRLKDFHKSDVLSSNKLIVVDYYKAWGLKGENVYTHLYINDISGELIINSFKEI
jgi:hypothetical protein